MTTYTEQDTKNDFERMKRGEITWNQVRGFNDEHKWWLIKNSQTSSFLMHDEEMTDEMMKYCILNGKSRFFETLFSSKPDNYSTEDNIKRIKNLHLTEEEWMQAIKNRKVTGRGMFFDNMFSIVGQCIDLTVDLAFEIIKNNPVMIMEKNIKSILLNSERKYEAFSFIIHQIMENNVHIRITDDFPIDSNTWSYLEGLNTVYLNHKELFKRADCPISIRRKAVEFSKDAWGIRDNMTAEDIIYWFELYNGKVISVTQYFKEFTCNDWETVITRKPEIFPYIPKQTAKLSEIAVKANPENIGYVRKPSEKLKALAITLNPKCKQYVEVTEKTCKLLGWDIEEKTPEPYPAPYYLVMMSEDLCDEGYLEYVEVIEGKNMKKFMEDSFSLHFGNLEDGETRYVKDCANIKELTKEEYQILCKLGLTHIESGHFYFENWN